MLIFVKWTHSYHIESMCLQMETRGNTGKGMIFVTFLPGETGNQQVGNMYFFITFLMDH